MTGRKKWSEIKQERAEDKEWNRLLAVVAKMSTFALLEHMDVSGSQMAKAVLDYRKDDSEDWPLLEIRRGLRELEAVTEELLLRWEAAHEE